MKCAIYMRVGRADQLSRDVCDVQQETLINYAKKNRLEVVEKYSDVGFSGNDTNRPGLKAMTADYAAGKFEKILTVDMAQLSRKSVVFPFSVQTVK